MFNVEYINIQFFINMEDMTYEEDKDVDYEIACDNQETNIKFVLNKLLTFDNYNEINIENDILYDICHLISHNYAWAFIIYKIIFNPELLLYLFLENNFNRFSKNIKLVKYLNANFNKEIDELRAPFKFHNKFYKIEINNLITDNEKIDYIITDYLKNKLSFYNYPAIKKRCDIIREELQRKIMHPKHILYMLDTYYDDDMEALIEIITPL